MNDVIPIDQREAVRAEWNGLPGFYSPWLHLALPSAFGVAVVVTALRQLHDARPWHAALAAGLFVLSNAAEWRIHRDVLHRRFAPVAFLYIQHSKKHHVIFVTGDMAIRGPREFRLVLIPVYGVVLAFAGLLPLYAALWACGLRDVAAITAAVQIGYLVLYEWLHLLWHAPADSRLGRLACVRALARHHAVHHDPRLMQRWNFNVTLPLWDRVRGTCVRSYEEAARTGR